MPAELLLQAPVVRRPTTWLSGLIWTLSWWAVIGSALAELPALGLLTVAGVLAAHVLAPDTRTRRIRLLLPVLSTGCGLLIEMSLIASGVLSYAILADQHHWPPPWILALWALLGAAWQRVLQAACGSCGGVLVLALSAPLAYAGAAAFGLVALQQPLASLSLALLYALVGGFFVLFDRRELP